MFEHGVNRLGQRPHRTEVARQAEIRVVGDGIAGVQAGKDVGAAKPVDRLLGVADDDQRAVVVGRAGIRYSDRPDDFRTGVLGLAETQIVKNSVIVPAGSKGGFVILDQPSLSVATRSEVERQYRTLMRGLLDLTDNLQRIRSHGDRANRIVQDMLSMGRGSGDRSSTDINQLLDEYARLAYHSARGTDQNFQLSIERDFDDAVGELNVVSQDLGRVFLNMVANSCYATDERREASKTDDGQEPFMPIVWLATRRHEDHIEVRIRDNGGGMPPEVVEKIFNPFFTTKPTGQGTGLGLAMCSDIVRQHGGHIRVDVEEGEGTEMIIDLPLVPPSDTAEQEADSLLTPSA